LLRGGESTPFILYPFLTFPVPPLDNQSQLIYIPSHWGFLLVHVGWQAVASFFWGACLLPVGLAYTKVFGQDQRTSKSSLLPEYKSLLGGRGACLFR
jgi:hypothetical protein